MIKYIFVYEKPKFKDVETDTPFVGTPSYKLFLGWINELYLDISDVAMVSINTDKFMHAMLAPHVKIIAIGDRAEKEVTGFRADYFKLPSPNSKKLKDKQYVKETLTQCRIWLNSFYCLPVQFEEKIQ